MALKLYTHPLSQPARAVLMFCKATSIPYEEKFVDLARGEQKSTDFTKLSPFQRVPVIDHNGFLLIESIAIFRYLARTFPVPDHWYPKDSKLQAKVDAFLSWQHLGLRYNGVGYFQTAHVIPRTTNTPVNEERLARFRKNLKVSLDEMANVWLKDGGFIAGKELTIADLLAAAEMEQPGMGGFDVKSYNKRIGEYMEDVRQAVQPHYDEVHAMCYKLQKKALNKA